MAGQRPRVALTRGDRACGMSPPTAQHTAELNLASGSARGAKAVSPRPLARAREAETVTETLQPQPQKRKPQSNAV